MKAMLICFLSLILPLTSYPQTAVTLKIEGAEKNGGQIHVSVFNSESSYKAREVYLSFSVEANNETAIKDIILPNGHYLFSVYQDSNRNKKLDTNLIGIPCEKFGFSNYDGKSAPGSFNRHKIVVDDNNRNVTIALYEI